MFSPQIADAASARVPNPAGGRLRRRCKAAYQPDLLQPLSRRYPAMRPSRMCGLRDCIPSFRSARYIVQEVRCALQRSRTRRLAGSGAAPARRKPSPLTILIVVPTLQAGAAEMGASILCVFSPNAGHRADRDVARRAARSDVSPRRAANSCMPMWRARIRRSWLRNAAAISRIVRSRKCDIIHAHGRAPAWSAFVAAKLTRVPFVTSWYKGFREQNALKRLYNSVMARGDRIVAVSDQLAEMISERYRVPGDRIEVVPTSVDLELFDPATHVARAVDATRRDFRCDGRATRSCWWSDACCDAKGHHIVVQRGAAAEGNGAEGFRLRLRRRGSGHQPLYRRNLGSGAGQRRSPMWCG